MRTLSETLVAYVEANYHPELQQVIFNSFQSISNFGNPYYEDEYINLISKRDHIDPDNMRLMFMTTVKKDLLNFITIHDIYVADYADIRIFELEKIANALYRLSKLEDYEEVSYIVNSYLPVRAKTINLIKYLTNLEEIRLYEIIERVDDTFIEDLIEFTDNQRSVETTEDTSHITADRLTYIRTFTKFLNNQHCLGLTYFDSGFNNVSLKELIDLLPYSVFEYISENLNKNSVQLALDILSLMIVTTDNYDNPIEKLEQHSSVLFLEAETATKVISIAKNIMQDFQLFLKASKEREVLS